MIRLKRFKIRFKIIDKILDKYQITSIIYYDNLLHDDNLATS